MKKPSAPPLPLHEYNNIPLVYPATSTIVNEQINNDEIYAKNLDYHLNKTHITNPVNQLVIIEKKETSNDIAKIGCAAALLTFCCMQ